VRTPVGASERELITSAHRSIATWPAICRGGKRARNSRRARWSSQFQVSQSVRKTFPSVRAAVGFSPKEQRGASGSDRIAGRGCYYLRVLRSRC
jgi:hypothetical protein